jgi:hypothetical protein
VPVRDMAVEPNLKHRRVHMGAQHYNPRHLLVEQTVGWKMAMRCGFPLRASAGERVSQVSAEWLLELRGVGMPRTGTTPILRANLLARR